MFSVMTHKMLTKSINYCDGLGGTHEAEKGINSGKEQNTIQQAAHMGTPRPTCDGGRRGRRMGAAIFLWILFVGWLMWSSKADKEMFLFYA